jgi:hypothetical protein
MNENPQLEYVKNEVKREIGLYEKRERTNRGAAFRFTIVPAALAALATVSIGASDKLGSTMSTALPILAMLATSVASVLGAWESLFSNRKQWHLNEVVLAELYVLRSDIEYREKDVNRPITQEETDNFFKEFKRIRAEGERAYQLARSSEQASVKSVGPPG